MQRIYIPGFILESRSMMVYVAGTRQWNVVHTRGFPVKGGYGHSSAWDQLTQRIYVYGGFISESPATPLLSNRLYAYEPNKHTW